MTKKGHQKF